MYVIYIVGPSVASQCPLSAPVCRLKVILTVEHFQQSEQCSCLLPLSPVTFYPAVALCLFTGPTMYTSWLQPSSCHYCPR